MKKLFSIIALFLVSITLVGCNLTTTPKHSASEVMDALEITYAEGDSATAVTGNIGLPLTSALESSAQITWESGNLNVIDLFGTVNRQDDDVTVTLILSVSLGSSSVQKFIDITVLGTTLYHTVTVDINGVETSSRIVDGSEFSEPQSPQITNFRFNGWTTNLTSNEPFDFDTLITEDITIYAIMTPIVTASYTIEIYIENLEDEAYSLFSTENYIAEVRTLKSIDTTITGFIVNQEESTLSGIVSSETTLVIKGYYDRVDYTLTLTDGANEISSSTYKYQTILTSVADPTKEGYEFLGWTTTLISSDYYTFDQPITSDMTLYAQWRFLDSYTYEGYYLGADGLTGTTLTSFLRTVVTTGYIGVSYGDTRYILDETDADPNIPGNIILVYRGTSVSGVWDGGVTWNKEHVWPQSLLGVSVDNSYIGVGSDLHNLKPANPSENSSRGNDYFDSTPSGLSYEPRDEVKGDVARILFYMTVRYDNLTLVNSTSPAVYQMAMLDTLLLWNIMDPVDSFEQHRNDVIYGVQNNRNPFIDHPEFVDKIWGTVATATQNDSIFLGIHTNTTLWVDTFTLSEEASKRSYIC